MPGKHFLLLGLWMMLAACAAPASSRAPAFFITPAEMKYGDLTPFYKWTGVLARLDTAPALPLREAVMEHLQSLPLDRMAENVNAIINAYPYRDDLSNWGQIDYWQTPAEFLARGGGDCEDFAIAKYVWLRELGVPEERLRLAVVYDTHRQDTHTVLTVHTDAGPLVLDNQVQEILTGLGGRYRPLYSINRQAWWRHSA